MTFVACVRNLSKIYRKPGTNVEVAALRSIDLDLLEGEFTAIMGDQDVSAMPDDQLSEIRSQRIGFVFQNFNLIQQLTVLENLEVPMFYLGITPQERRRRAMALAEKVGLADRADHRPMQLSGGQQQRVCIARSLINEPLILLADEPTGALDSKTGQAILELFDELVAQGKTLILVTHDPSVGKRAHRVIQLHDGKVVKDERNARPAEPVPVGGTLGEGH